MLVCTDVFEELAAAEARALGFGEIRKAVLPHPLRSLSESELEVRGIGRNGAEQIMAMFLPE